MSPVAVATPITTDTDSELDARLTAVLCAPRVGDGAAGDLREWLVHADAALFRSPAPPPPPAEAAVPRAVGDGPPPPNAAGPLTDWGQAALLRIMEAAVQNRGVFVAPVVEWLKGRALPTIVDAVGPPTPERELILSLLSSFMDICLRAAEDSPTTDSSLPAPKRARTECDVTTDDGKNVQE